MATNDSEQYVAMVAGVEEIVTVVARYQQIEALYLLRPETALKQDFERHLVSLYKQIIRYQISATCYYRRNTMRKYSCIVVAMSTESGADETSSTISACHPQARRRIRGDSYHPARRSRLQRHWPGFRFIRCVVAQ